MKSRKDILMDFKHIVGQYKSCFFKLTDGKDCFGEIDLVDSDFLQFSPDWDEQLEDHDYERHYDYDFSPGGSLEFILIPLQDVDIDHLYYWSKEKHCFINAQWSIDQESWIHNETKPGSIPLPKNFPKPIEDDKRLKKVGYWQSDQWEPYLPHPKYLVEPGWRESERSMIIAYLKSGHECGHVCFYLDCLLKDWKENTIAIAEDEFIELLETGFRELTDGEWIWPSGLAYYVEKYGVCLPDQFVETMQRNSWLVPENMGFKGRSEVGVSSLYWTKWVIEYVQSKQS